MLGQHRLPSVYIKNFTCLVVPGRVALTDMLEAFIITRPLDRFVQCLLHFPLSHRVLLYVGTLTDISRLNYL
jgi:hypothetical protein